MNEIKEFLQNPINYTFGLSLLSKHSRNKTLVETLRRRENKAKLIYELSKYTQAQPAQPTEQPFAKLVNPKPKVDYSQLPDEIKPYYDKAMVAYQNARKNHYAMKAAKVDAARVEMRGNLLENIAENHAAWEVVNKWQSTGELPIEGSPSQPSLASLATSLTRTLDKLDKLDVVNDDSIRAELVGKCVKLAHDLIAGGRVLSVKTTARLQAHNIEI